MSRMALWLCCLCCLVLMLAACGDNGTSPTTVDATTAPVAEASTTVAASTTAAELLEPVVVPIEVAACDLITADEVTAATGLAVVEIRDEPPIACIFDLGADAGVDIFVSVDDGQGRITGPAAVFENYQALVADGEAEPIPGLGEAALYAAEFRGLAVNAGGGKFISLGVNGSFQQLQDPRDALVSLAESALGRL